MPNRRSFLALAATATAAAAFFTAPASAAGSLVDVQLVDRRSNEMLTTYSQRGSTWVAGRPSDDDVQAMDAATKRQGSQDCRIAAVAMGLDYVVVTASIRHFSRIPGVRCEDWTA